MNHIPTHHQLQYAGHLMNDYPTDIQQFDAIAPACEQLRKQVGKAIIGQTQTLDLLLTALLCHGHVLLIGVPGLAKTRLVRALGNSLDLPSARVQFTADLMPVDILGTELIQPDQHAARRIEFVKGPVFTSLLLADEINRASPRTQAALLQAMAERQVTIAGHTHSLNDPFMVIATQNPIEQEGTYLLPEAQLDRFMFSHVMSYPSAADELAIAQLRDESLLDQIQPVASQDQVATWAKLIRQMPISDVIAKQAIAWVRATRPDSDDAPEKVREFVQWGAGAAMQGRPTATLDDLKHVAPAVLCHRLVLNFAASADHVTESQIIDHVMQQKV
jgi:MoxR-like ATPase